MGGAFILLLPSKANEKDAFDRIFILLMDNLSKRHIKAPRNFKK